MVQLMQSNWKTSALGVFGLMTAVGSLGTDLLSGHVANIAIYLPTIVTSVGLLFAKDSTAK